MSYECDCGAVYGHPDQINYCASNHHFQAPRGNESLAKKLNELVDIVLLMPEISETMPLTKVVENAEKIRRAKYAMDKLCQEILKESG